MSKKPKSMKAGPHIIVISDLHVGCQMALCPPKGGRNAEGGIYRPSPFQKKLYKMWKYFWDEWVPRITAGDYYDIVINGECCDGSHHNSVSQWTHNTADQSAAAIDLLRPIVDACPGKLHVIRGTECHAGQSGSTDEMIARELDAERTQDGQSSGYELWKMLGGALVHFTHHIGSTSSPVSEMTAPQKELVNAFCEAGRWGTRPPDVVVRSHRHRYACVENVTVNGKATSVVTPCWQGKTPFVYRLAGARSQQPQFGGIALSWSKKEQYAFERHKIWTMDPPEAMR